MPNRRQFLQMLGLGGASLAVSATAKASPIVPLFSGKESKIWTPEHTSLTRSHLVLTRPKQLPPTHLRDFEGATHPLFGGRQRGTEVRRSMWPMFDGERIAHSDWGANPEDIKVRLEDGDDPHEAYYKASMEMRRQFAVDSKKRFEAIYDHERPYTTLVTLVDHPILAVPPWHGEGRGFDLMISYTPHQLPSTEDIELNGWEIYSENGEFPIEVPTDIDMDALLRIDSHIITGKTNPLKLRGKIITL